MRILFIGDIVGEPGRKILDHTLPELRITYRPDFVIVNGENSAPDGRGITPQIADWFISNGIDLITTGNHVWGKREIIDYIPYHTKLIRPANFPGGCPGQGTALIALPDGRKLGVINLMGRVFMREHLACPLRTAQAAITYLKTLTPYILIDMHAETTSEKTALAYFLDGQVSAVIGTHTHVPTADERILPQGTAFITDAGMCGAVHSLLGMKKGPIIEQFLTQMPQRFCVETEGPIQLCGVIVDLHATGTAVHIERIHRVINSAHNIIAKA